MFSSLSKRSNVPGLRSGFVAGDAAILKKFWLYRTYQGCAMSPPVQHASIAGLERRGPRARQPPPLREKFDAVTPLIARTSRRRIPDAGFYLWARTPIADTEFARGLQGEYNVTVLPGSYLAREAGGVNPGELRPHRAGGLPRECLEAARRIEDFFCRKL
jgi:N-succinyldiaminopimelate aminotransferase